jgi:hypothetical protein
MKTSLTQNHGGSGKLPPFPFLVESTHDNPRHCFTVLATAEGSGIVVHRASEEAAWKVGQCYSGFTPFYRTEHWRVLSPSESITLKND